MKLLKIGLAGGLVLVLGAWAAFHLFFSLSVPDYTGRVALAGLPGTVQVRTDRYGIPHIFAKDERSLFFAQGYITARERMFQMEITRLAGRGELSRLFGEVTLAKDRFLKTVGFHRVSAASYRAMPAAVRNILDAYAAGVNAYLQTASHLPREFVILRYTPQPWQPEDSIAAAMLMSYSLTRSKKVELVLHNLRESAGEEIFQLFKPAYPDFAPTLVTGGTPVRGSAQIGFARAFENGEPLADALADFDPFSFDFPASNWMIFSGKLTDTGKPYFAGSPDLKPTLPALFYITRLKGAGFDVIGGSLPGVPCVGPLGFNGQIAWSAVNGRGDELDYFIEKINPANPDQYLTESGWRDFKTIEEVLKIKDGNRIREEKLVVRISRHGPMISPVLPDAPANCAMQWTALMLPNLDIAGLVSLNKAKNFDEFQAACRQVRTMNLNLGYADAAGNIGWHFTGAPPLRKRGDGTVPVPGWTGEYDWQGFAAPDKIAWDLNPQKGYVASFNNDPGNVPYHLTNFYLFERAMRFAEIMERRGGGKITLQELEQMQLDTVSVVAERWVPLILAACKHKPGLAAYCALFEGWDYAIDIASPAATLFNGFYLAFMKNTFQDDVGKKLWRTQLSQPYIFYVPDLLMTRIRDAADHRLFDDRRTPDRRETREDIIVRSLRETVKTLSASLGKDVRDWQWGSVHQMYFEHPLGSKLGFFNLKPIPTNGSHHTINSGFWESDKPFKMASGGVIRMMVDFDRVANSTIISPPGQSGHYQSPYYDNLARMWADGKQVPMHFATAEKLPSVLTLVPKQ